MDQRTAKHLLITGGTFIFLDVPEGTEFGIDLKSYNTGENFRGVKMIPPGLHYIFYSGVSSTGDTSPRTGFFYNFKRSEVVVRKWDKKTEDISNETVSEEEIARLKDNIMVLDKFLGPYPYDISDKWNNLTCFISKDLAEQLSPLSGKICSALELFSCPDSERPRGKKINRIIEGVKTNEELIINKTDEEMSDTETAMSSRIHEEGLLQKTKRKSTDKSFLEDELLPILKAKPGTELRVTSIPEKNYPDGSSASEITQHSLDKTFVLETMLARYNNPTDILGEVAFVFICFLAGHSLEAFEHWKKLIILLCSCDVAIKKYRDVYDKFISLLEVQIKEIPEDFLADIVSNNNFVYLKLRDLFRNVQESDVDGRLKTKVERFQENLTEVNGWDFSHLNSDEEDELPVIVEI